MRRDEVSKLFLLKNFSKVLSSNDLKRKGKDYESLLLFVPSVEEVDNSIKEKFIPVRFFVVRKEFLDFEKILEEGKKANKLLASFEIEEKENTSDKIKKSTKGIFLSELPFAGKAIEKTESLFIFENFNLEIKEAVDLIIVVLKRLFSEEDT